MGIQTPILVVISIKSHDRPCSHPLIHINGGLDFGGEGVAAQGEGTVQPDDAGVVIITAFVAQLPAPAVSFRIGSAVV